MIHVVEEDGDEDGARILCMNAEFIAFVSDFVTMIITELKRTPHFLR